MSPATASSDTSPNMKNGNAGILLVPQPFATASNAKTRSTTPTTSATTIPPTSNARPPEASGRIVVSDVTTRYAVTSAAGTFTAGATLRTAAIEPPAMHIASIA